MPTNKNSVWGHFKEILVAGTKRAKCKLCDGEVVNNPARMAKHLDKYRKKQASEDNTTRGEGIGPSTPKILKQTTIPIANSALKQHEIDMHITRYFVATNTPFNAVGNYHFVALMQKVIPGTVVPKRNKL